MARKRVKSKKNSQVKEVWRRFRKNKLAVLGLIVFTIILLMTIFADFIVPYEMCETINAKISRQPPSLEHIFGTDDLGRDEFARVLHGGRNSLSIGIVTVMVSLICGGLIGAVSGYFGGLLDDIVQRFVEVFNCLPTMLFTLAVVTVLEPSLPNLMLAIILTNIPNYVRLTRSAVMGIADETYIEAARSYGASNLRIILRYIIPNCLGPIIVQGTMGIASMILAAAALSYIGMGIQPPAPEWGSMLNSARNYIRTEPYLLYFPGIMILISALSLNLLGDGLRDALDPKLKN